MPKVFVSIGSDGRVAVADSLNTAIIQAEQIVSLQVQRTVMEAEATGDSGNRQVRLRVCAVELNAR